MIFLGRLSKITEEKYNIGLTHYMPFSEINGMGKSKEQLEKEGVLIENIIKAKQIDGKFPIMYYNPKIKNVFYEYEDIPKSKEELQQENINNLVKIIAQLNLDNKKKEAIATTLVQTIASLNLRLNKLEKGVNDNV